MIKDMESYLQDLHARRTLGAGTAKDVATQHGKHRLTARERIDLLFDSGTFTEIDTLVLPRHESYPGGKGSRPGDGVITGFGLVNGRRVFASSQDASVMGGSLGEMHANKIVKAMQMALKYGCPFIAINDSGGARIQEGVDSLKGYGEIFYRNSRASGVIPQITAIMGPCAGGAVYSPAMTDFVFMVKNTSFMFITGPDVIRAVTGEETTQEELGGAMTHNSRSGNAHFACENDADAIQQIKILLSYLPTNNMEDAPRTECGDDPWRLCPNLDSIIPDSPKESYSMHEVIKTVLDDGIFFEPHLYYAQNIIVGFGRLNGRVVGVVANQPKVLAGCLDIDASDKATRFIRFCDAFNIPLLTFVDVPGYLPGTQQEHNGIIRHGAKLLWCYAEATVPKLTVVTRKAYGGSYIPMSSRHLGADMVLAWPSAEIAVMGAQGAANIIFRKEIEAAEDKAAKRAEMIQIYEEEFNNPYVAASRGYVDAVILPSETRKRLIDALEILSSKSESLPPKKHGNIPA